MAVVVFLRKIVDILFHRKNYNLVGTLVARLPRDHVDGFVTHKELFVFLNVREIIVEGMLWPPVNNVVIDLEHLGGLSKAIADVHDPYLVLLLNMDHLGSCVHIYRHHHTLFHGVVSYVKLSLPVTKTYRVYFPENILALVADKYRKEYQNSKLLHFNNAARANIERQQNLLAGISDFCRHHPFVFFGLFDFLLSSFGFCLATNLDPCGLDLSPYDKLLVNRYHVLVKGIVLSVI